MKYEVTRSHEVGSADHGWLKAKHYFSFANYYNPKKMGFGKLRVINDDLIAAGKGFGTHPHKDMEIITIPLQGAVSHEDSMGNKGSIHKGEVQVMSAGTGVMHSEFNHSKVETLGLFQIWVEPNKKGVSPRYDQKKVDYQKNKNQWTTLVAPMDARTSDGLKIHQKAYIKAAYLEKGQGLDFKVSGSGQGVFVLVSEGQVSLADISLSFRDAIAISEIEHFLIHGEKDSEVIVIEVPL